MESQADNSKNSRAERAVSDIVMAELFLVQATIESASALGEGLTGLREQLSSESDTGEDFRTFLERTRKQLTEPYTSRFSYWRDIASDSKES
jgi:hypothetical protein